MRIGPVVRKDVMRASTMLEHEEKYAIILAFDVKVKPRGRPILVKRRPVLGPGPALPVSRWSVTPRKWPTERGSRYSRQKSSTTSLIGDLLLLSLASFSCFWHHTPVPGLILLSRASRSCLEAPAPASYFCLWTNF